jgi:hypothetical protein
LSENEYVATAAAEKRLCEVLADKLGRDYDIEEIALTLLHGAKIEYKARAKQVVISLDLPDTAATRKPKAADDFGPDHPGANDTPPDFGETAPAPPQPHIAPFQPKHDPEADYEDVHYD